MTEQWRDGRINTSDDQPVRGRTFCRTSHPRLTVAFASHCPVDKMLSHTNGSDKDKSHIRLISFSMKQRLTTRPELMMLVARLMPDDLSLVSFGCARDRRSIGEARGLAMLDSGHHRHIPSWRDRWKGGGCGDREEGGRPYAGVSSLHVIHVS